MPKNYVLIDYENVQPKNFLPLLPHTDFHIRVFLGATQSTLNTKIATALQPFGANAGYIQASGNGKNALDFHIAFYMGRHSGDDGVSFYIVSKDKGFDALITHLNTKGIAAKRVAEINKIPVLKNFTENSTEGKVQKILTNLKSRGKSVPKTEKTLRNTISTLFEPSLKDDELTNIIGRMKNLNQLNIDDSSVRYLFN